MQSRTVHSRNHDRRLFLKAAGVSIALPALESLPRLSATAQSPEPSQRLEQPRRMVCIGNEFGMYPGAFWPESTGSNYEMSELLRPLEAHRRNFLRSRGGRGPGPRYRFRGSRGGGGDG